MSLSEKSEKKTRISRIKTYKAIVDKRNESLKWKKLKCGLWKSKTGEIGFKTQEGTEQGIFIVKYIVKIGDKKMSSVIDLKTFKHLGSSFYKDKNHIYTHYSMASGGSFFIVQEADLKTFKVIGDCYAKDKNHIFGERHMIIKSADYKTFKTKKGVGCFAKDKNGYYFWDSKLDLEDLDEYSKKAVGELNKL